MKQLSIDFEKCPGEKYCKACGDVYAECEENSTITFKEHGWAEEQYVNKLIAKCPHKAIKIC